VLEEATKKTEAEQAQKLHNESLQQSPLQPSRENTQPPSTPTRGSQSPSTSNENTPTQRPNRGSPYSSPQEASYASLARSIAVAAAAAAAVANGPTAPPPSGIPMLGHNPFFNSAMMTRSQSAYSECSTLSTSLSGTSSFPGTPFDYPRNVAPPGETPLPSNDPSNISIAQQFPDFAAAVDANVLKRPTTLMHPRHVQLSSTDVPRRGGRPALTRINSCPADFVDAFGSVALNSPTVERPPITLASVAEQQTKKRSRPRLSPLGIGMQRSQSSMGVCQVNAFAYSPVEPQYLNVTQRSPTLQQVATSSPTPSTDGTNTPTKSIQFKKETPEKYTTAFLSADVPPTPISPASLAAGQSEAFNESPTMSLARAAGLTQLKRPQIALNTEDIFSPPATPANSLNMQRGYSFSSAADYSDVYVGSYNDHFSTSPTQFAIPHHSALDYANAVDDVFAMSFDPSQDIQQEAEFPNYLAI